MSRSLDQCAQHEKVMFDECQLVNDLKHENNSLKAMIKLWEERNAESVKEIEYLESACFSKDKDIEKLKIDYMDLKAKLTIAVDALIDTTFSVDRRTSGIAKGALKQITEVEGKK